MFVAAVAGGVVTLSGLVGTYIYRKRRRSKYPTAKRTQVKSLVLSNVSQDAFLSSVSQSMVFLS